jgi:hypothetical protein
MTMLRMRVHQIQGQYSSDQEESQIAQFQNGKTKLYTAEIRVSRKCTLKDHFFETFLILCRINVHVHIPSAPPSTKKGKMYM